MSPHAHFFHLQIVMLLGIYTPNVIFLSLLSGSQTPRPSFFFISSLSLPISLTLFLWGVAFGAAGAFQEDMLVGQKRETKEDADIYILSVCLVNVTLACLLLMQCCSMHMVPGGAGHVWFIRSVPTHRLRAFIPVISIPERRSLQTLTSSLADSGGWQTDPQVTGRFLLMADVVIWHSLNLAHMLTEWKHVSPFHTHAEYMNSFVTHAEGDSSGCFTLLQPQKCFAIVGF